MRRAMRRAGTSTRRGSLSARVAVVRKIPCLVRAIIDHGERVYTRRARAIDAGPAFKPGQFLHLAIDPYDGAGFWPESRVFSIASSPGDRDRP